MCGIGSCQVPMANGSANQPEASGQFPLAKLVAERRREMGLTLAEVARLMDRAAGEADSYCLANRQAIHEYEHGRIPYHGRLRLLAAALGVKAVKNGFSVAHFLLDDLMHILRADAAIPPARLRAKRYFNAALVIIDEVGFRPLDRAEANLFFRLVSARYERGAIVLTSNKHVRDWPEIFAGDEILTTAILDRLLHHVAIVHIDGKSYRLRELDALLSPAAESAMTAG